MRLSVQMVIAGICWPGFASECSRISVRQLPFSMPFSMRGTGASAAAAVANGNAHTAAMMIRMVSSVWRSASLCSARGARQCALGLDGLAAVVGLVGEVLRHALIGRARVRLHALEARDARGDRRELA